MEYTVTEWYIHTYCTKQVLQQGGGIAGLPGRVGRCRIPSGFTIRRTTEY